MGRSGLKVSVLGLGANSFGGRADKKTSIKIIHTALDHGVTLIDTANGYTGGQSEEILAAQRDLAHGGIFVEPASAATYAGLQRLHAAKRLPPGPVVGILTGTGLKDGTTPLMWVQSREKTTDSQGILDVIRTIMRETVGYVAH